MDNEFISMVTFIKHRPSEGHVCDSIIDGLGGAPANYHATFDEGRLELRTWDTAPYLLWEVFKADKLSFVAETITTKARTRSILLIIDGKVVYHKIFSDLT